MSDDKPKITYTVWATKKRTDPDMGEQHDTYDDHNVAKEFATELVEHCGYYDACVVNSKGVRFWEARKNGVRPIKKKRK